MRLFDDRSLRNVAHVVAAKRMLEVRPLSLMGNSNCHVLT